MIQLSDEQLHNLGKEALIVIVSSLQDQLLALQSQLDHANAQLSDNNWQIELLTEQIRIINQRFFGRKSETSVSEIDGQLSLFDSFNEVEYLKQDSSKEPEITEVIIPSYHRKKSVGKRDADLSGLLVSSNTHFPMRNWPTGFLTATRNFRQKFINVSTSFWKHLSWMSITFMSMPQKAMTELSSKLQDQKTFSATVLLPLHWSLPSSMVNTQTHYHWSCRQKLLRRMVSSFPQTLWQTG